MAKSADYLDPNRDLEQEERYYQYLNNKMISIRIRAWLRMKNKQRRQLAK